MLVSDRGAVSLGALMDDAEELALLSGESSDTSVTLDSVVGGSNCGRLTARSTGYWSMDPLQWTPSSPGFSMMQGTACSSRAREATSSSTVGEGGWLRRRRQNENILDRKIQEQKGIL